MPRFARDAADPGLASLPLPPGWPAGLGMGLRSGLLCMSCISCDSSSAPPPPSRAAGTSAPGKLLTSGAAASPEADAADSAAAAAAAVVPKAG